MEHPHLLNCQADSLQMCHLGSLYLYRTIYMCVCVCVCVCVCSYSVQSVSQFSHSVMSDSFWPHGMEFPVHHQLPEITQIHFHPVGDVIQPAHPLQSPSPAAFYLSEHRDVFQWIRSSHQVVKVLGLQLWHQSFQWIFRMDFL